MCSELVRKVSYGSERGSSLPEVTEQESAGGGMGAQGSLAQKLTLFLLHSVVAWCQLCAEV